ncbi:MAG: hypothetical protein WD768_01075 [Phycisphaeraceae bacterium]
MVQQLGLLEQVIDPSQGDLKPDLARYILSLSFPEPAQKRYLVLSEKAQEGSLSPEEEAELDGFLEVNAFLTVIQSKARISLKRSSPAA